ncbi:MAG: hypothetical protein IT427_15995 [Pirellulales bacterium]|nr:hypothetical protein [Pirellulales bacterium]
MDWLALALRWIHIVAAITAVGGTIFMRMALLPSEQSLDDESRHALRERVRSRWAKVVMACIAFLLLSGLINFFTFIGQTKAEPWSEWRTSYNKLYNMIFGIKALLALVIFFIASALVGRTDALKPIRQNAKMWLTVNVVLAVLVVALSGVLRSTHIGPTLPTTRVEATETAHG